MVFVVMGVTMSDLFGIAIKAQRELFIDPGGTASAWAVFGYAHWHIQQYEDALGMLTFARDKFEGLHRIQDATLCLLWTSQCHFTLTDLHACLRTCEEGIKLARQVGYENRICQLSFMSARCHIRLEQYDEALELCRKSLPLIEKSGQPLYHAQFLELSGFAFGMKKEYEGALLGYSRAKSVYSDVDPFPTSTKGLARCNRNIRRIGQAKGDEEQVILEII
jgi:tetratricopeptide (TPR) repeat protein